MLLKCRFGSPQSALGYQFMDRAGALIGERLTAGIVALPETGAYQVEAVVPDAAVEVYWLDTESGAEAGEDLTMALRFEVATVNDPVVVPSPPEDGDLCTVFIYTANLLNAKRAGIEVSVALCESPAKTGRVLESAPAVLITDAQGFASRLIQRTDRLTPAGRYYLVNCQALGLSDLRMELTEPTFNLAALIV